jgi:hypothetical protein
MADFTLGDLQKALAGPAVGRLPPSQLAVALSGMPQQSVPDVPLPYGSDPFTGSPDRLGVAREGVGLPDPGSQLTPWERQQTQRFDTGPVGRAANTMAQALETGAQFDMPALGMIKAYHGSPYDFDAFDMSKIGTGEGAQVYGHGLYFAENPEVADSYGASVADRHLKDWETSAGGKVPSWIGKALHNHAPGSPEWTGLVDQYRHDFANRIRESEEELKDSGQPWNIESRIAAQKSTLDALDQLKTGELKPRGRTYEVAIDAHPDEFLDWDKPLSEQSQSVKDALGKVSHIAPEYLKSKTMTGGQIIPQTPQGMESMRAAGIKGIRYLDQGSRGSGEGTSNYVVFDDKTISILKKYGLAGLGIGLGSAAASGLYPTEQPKSGPTPVAMLGVRG